MSNAFSGDWPLPSVVRLPGCRVRVKLYDATEAQPDGMWLYNHDKGVAAILLDSKLPLTVQRYTLLHELLHGVHEVIDLMLEKYPGCVRTKHMEETLGTFSLTALVAQEPTT